MIRRFKKEIDGATYEGNTLPARQGLSIGARLMKLLAPSLGKLVGADSTDALLDGKNNSLISDAIAILVSKLEQTDVAQLCMDLLGQTYRTGPIDDKNPQPVQMQPGVDPKEFDIVYNSNYVELFNALVYMVEVNLPGFFDKLPIGKVWDRAKAEIDSRISGTESEQESTQS